jgi:hypothetical protein
MFRIVKYLNNVHSGVYEKQPVVKAALELLLLLGREFKSEDPEDLLLFYRKMELER